MKVLKRIYEGSVDAFRSWYSSSTEDQRLNRSASDLNESSQVTARYRLIIVVIVYSTLVLDNVLLTVVGKMHISLEYITPNINIF